MKRNISIPVNDIKLEGILYIPEHARGIVIFAHGSGSSRLSPRNNYVADFINNAGCATLLFDLLTKEEEEYDRDTAQLRFDIIFLSDRLEIVTQWIAAHETTKDLNIGYFGSSTGAAAALVAAAHHQNLIKSVVSRGGRPDLVQPELLAIIKAPTLFIVGGKDEAVIGFNELAYNYMGAEKKIEIIPGATHLFEEPGKLEAVALLASEWFAKYLS
jgi:dienelactone hydrolase